MHTQFPVIFQKCSSTSFSHSLRSVMELNFLETEVGASLLASELCAPFAIDSSIPISVTVRHL